MELFESNDKIKLKVYDALKNVIDPELEVNIVDLGLVYTIDYSESDGIRVVMTLSSQGCPMGEVILGYVSETLTKEFPEIKNNIELVWTPEWCNDFIKPAGRIKLGMD